MAFTLRFLATGEKYQSMQYSFRVHRTTMAVWIPIVCQAIRKEYDDEFLSCPETPEKWLEVEEGFRRRWNFPHSLGAVDGKHVAIRKPRRGHSMYFNYKSYHSIVLFAVADADYKFLWVDVGSNGACSDAQIMNRCEFNSKIADGSIGRPVATPIVPGERAVEYFFLGDDAFALKTWMMKPYSSQYKTKEQRVFNYRCSRARRVVENAFGLLAQRFQCLLSTMQQEPEVVAEVTLTAVVLHNILRTRYPKLGRGDVDLEDQRHRPIPARWRNRQMTEMPTPMGATRATQLGKEQRDYLRDYFNSPAGAVEWQEEMLSFT